MPPRGAERWFHTLVVVGAALGGCGGKSTEEGHSSAGASGEGISPGGSGSGGGTGTGAPTSPDDCEFDAAFVCQDYAQRSTCHCDPTRPRDASACSSPFDFTCTDVACTSTVNQVCLGTRLVGCSCDVGALKPESCEAPELFFCDKPNPPFRGCACRPGPASEPAWCPDSYCCQSVDPRFGCDCSCERIK